MVRLDYDRIAEQYDEPERDHAPDPDLAAFLERRGDGAESTISILDVGCGTGKQLAADHQRWPSARLVGIDRSTGMLRIARGRCPAAEWIRADGAALPLTHDSIDYATSQYSYPHIGNTRTLLAELYRVLRPGGRFVMTHIDPWAMPGWFVYQYFPEARDLDHRDFLRVAEFVAMLGDVGFRAVRVRTVDRSRDEDLEAFLAFSRARHRASQLMAIPDEAYAAGLRRLERDLTERGSTNRTARFELVVVTIAADKPRAGSAA